MTPPAVKWSSDGKLLYLHENATRHGIELPNTTYVIPIQPGWTAALPLRGSRQSMLPQRLSENVSPWEIEFSRVGILPSMRSRASPRTATFSAFKCSSSIGLKGTRP